MKKGCLITIMALALLLGQTAQAAETNCEKYGIISAGDYIIQNNVWGADTAQCITYSGGTSWTVSTSAHNQGSVAAYPSIYKGCHWGTCTPSSGMPIRVSSCSSANFNFSVSSARPEGNYNVAAEAWLSPNTDTSGGYSGGAEIMIVLDYHGMYPAGSQVGTFSGHDVYYANVGWNFVTYVQTGRNSASGNMMDFINDAMSRGYVQSSWYLHVMEAGFEIMSGGQGLSCNSFSFSVSGGGTTSTTTTASSTSTTTTSGGGCDCGTCDWYGTNVPMCCESCSGWGWYDGGCRRSCVCPGSCPGGGTTSTTTTAASTSTTTTAATTSTTTTAATTSTTTTAATTSTTTTTSGGSCDCGTCSWWGTQIPTCCESCSGWGWYDGGCNRSCVCEGSCPNN